MWEASPWVAKKWQKLYGTLFAIIMEITCKVSTNVVHEYRIVVLSDVNM